MKVILGGILLIYYKVYTILINQVFKLLFHEADNLDTTSFESELLLTVYAAFAQEESLSISENMRGGIRQRFKLGIPKVSQVYG